MAIRSRLLLASLLASAILAPGWVVSDRVASAQENPTQAESPTPAVTTEPQQTPPQTLEVILRDRGQALWETHQIALICAGGVLVVYLGVWGVRPLWLLALPSADWAIPGTPWKVPMAWVRWLKYRDRVLDAWVEQHWETVQAGFLRLPTVAYRAIHIALPVDYDQQLVETLSGKELAPTFAKRTAVVLLTGEGGAGKTSLACQIAQWGLARELAKHRLLPVLVETELDDRKSLLEAIRGQLNALANVKAIAPELLEQLLRRRRVLVIVDHLSEMSEATRQEIRPELADFPVKALLVTSRLRETLGGVPLTVLEPLRIEGSRLSRFMDAYLACRQKRDLFEDEEYFDACRRLSRMVGTRNITVLLARLYADQMIAQQAGAGGTLPANVPELMLNYVTQVNSTLPPAIRRDNLLVHEDAQRVAWECLKATYRPTTASRKAVLDALAGEEARARLDYLKERLRLVETQGAEEKIRIVLDPLAEYLAALAVVEANRSDPATAWAQFFDSIDTVLARTNDAPEQIQGFLLAVRDCCVYKCTEARVPDEVPERLAEKAGVDPVELQRLEENRRIRLLIAELSAPELEYREQAARNLGRRGLAAAAAIPNLLGMVANPNQVLAARQAAAEALGQLGASSEALRDRIAPTLLSLLQGQDDEVAVRRRVAEALGVMRTGQVELLRVLADGDQPLMVRQGAARALSLIGAPSGEAVPMLIVTLRAGEVSPEVKPIRVWREALTEALTLDLVAIPGGKFLMGSPPEEAGRDWYHRYYPDTEGLNVEAQHQVTVSSFWMSQFPITQAQWRFVSQLPKLNRDLDPDPANFKGDDRPVEMVSWYDTIEFCDRLSQYTGNTYRLPSEAEWEYACRAGTTTPFHLGETLSTEFANYNGNDAYGEGVKGEYRQQTTPVGSFGVANAWGLFDLHGNVWEWCLDHWHPSYEGAPQDGSDWITNGNDRYRLLRGGSWGNNPGICRSANRVTNAPGSRYVNNGFRVACLASWT